MDIALRVCDKAEFLATKKRLLSLEYHEDSQTKMWPAVHLVMAKAIRHERFTASETMLGDVYNNRPGTFEIRATETHLFFPTWRLLDNSEPVVQMNLEALDNDVTRSWFQWIAVVSPKTFDSRRCSAEDCSRYYVRRGRKDQKVGRRRCRLRTWRKK